ncbi:hypothetical protein MPH_10704 [Macrophomina phaseolina MS6]|uniref:Uncharacterized protein n=1 Tax=Macrophomina phaseolina (strain MS6) TaxID=1126212 RepID=K2QQM1_MACPH|nr:hypothetical protein MPH_10704 [Macrophomina phaseolina MS6]
MSSAAVRFTSSARSGLPLSKLVVTLTIVCCIQAFLGLPWNVVAACYSTWALICCGRLLSGDTTAIFDGLLFVTVLTLSNATLLWASLDSFSAYLHSVLPVILSAFLVAAFLISGVFYKSQREEQQKQAEDVEPTKHCRPLIFPCRTTHARMFPKKHSFAYSYLLAGVPVGPKQHHGRYGSMLSVDNNLKPWPANRKGWFHIQGSDYLDRGNENLDLNGKLTQYLRSQVCSQSSPLYTR